MAVPAAVRPGFLSLSKGANLTIVSGVVTITDGYHEIVSESSTSDDLSTINLDTGYSSYFTGFLPYIVIQATSGHTITVVHDPSPSAGEIFLTGEANLALSGNKLLVLYLINGTWRDTMPLTAPSGGYIGGTSPTITTPSFVGLETAVGVYKFAGINGLNLGQTIIVPSRTSKRFIPVSALVELATISGAGTVPSIRLGSNGSWDNLAAIVALTGLTTQYQLFPLTLANTTSLDVGSTGISVDVQTAATGYSPYTINVYVTGYYR